MNLCDLCRVPKMENSGDGVTHPLEPVLWCNKKKIEIVQPAPGEDVEECEHFVCSYCNGAGYVVSITGEDRGVCYCPPKYQASPL